MLPKLTGETPVPPFSFMYDGQASPSFLRTWQLHRSDLDEGLVLAFRRKDCPQATRAVTLRGLTAEKLYTVTWIDDQRRETTQSMPGRELAETPLSLPQPRSSMLLR